VAALNALIGSPLPSWCTLFVNEARVDLLRVVLRGAEGTHFRPLALAVDVWLPSDYPASPPKLWAHTRGRRLHPALHSSGRVCLRVLGEWRAVGQTSWKSGATKLVDVLTELHECVLSALHGHYFSEASLHSDLRFVLRDSDLLQATVRYDEYTFLTALRLALAQLDTPPTPALVASAVRAHWNSVRAQIISVAEYAAALLPWRLAALLDAPMPVAPLDALTQFHVPLNPSAPFLAALVTLLPSLRSTPQ
jgi:ubiquitin-conjugating enzyme E2 O